MWEAANCKPLIAIPSAQQTAHSNGAPTLPPHIRPFQPPDLTRIQDIAAAAWQPVFRSSEQLLGTDLFNLVSPDPEAAKRGQVADACEADSDTDVWVVEDGDEIVGFITADLNRDTSVGEIRNNAVDPNRQSGGLGKLMYDFVLERMREAGMKAVKVNTGADEAHAHARRAYEKAGFERSIPSVMYYLAL